jgi:N-acyl-D-aspartate/D-glutamate deacylase
MIDLKIRGGQMIDGTGASRRQADIGVHHGRIVALGEVDDDAQRTIDADGMIVAPGFIDVHTHLDVQVFWDPTMSPSPLHGVTTIVGGNSGFSVAPLTDDAASYLMRMLARVEGMPLESLESGVPWNWQTTGEYLDRLEGQLAVNAGFMVGHSTIRRVVMGEAASERAATATEIEAMSRLVHDGLAAGALGFSSTKSQSHSDAEGRPVPSRFATDDELVQLAGICRDYAGTSLEFLPHTGPEFPPSIVELMTRMSVAARRPLNWNLLVGSAANYQECLDKLQASAYARAHGGKIVALGMSQRVSSRLNFRTGFVLDMLPDWSDAMALPPHEKLQLLADPTRRRELEALANQPSPYSHLADWSSRRIVETFTPGLERYEGRLVRDIAAEEGKGYFDALMDIVCQDDLRTTFDTPVVDTRGDWEARAALLRHPDVLVGGSDAGAHLDVLGTFNYTTMLLAQGVREQQLFTTEEAVELLTRAPAQLYGLTGRGTLNEGAIADIVVFDEATVGSDPLATTWDLPAGAQRLCAGATGIPHVIVGGQEIVRDGEITNVLSGQVLRSGRDTSTSSLS